jgi:hypothetical protein
MLIGAIDPAVSQSLTACSAPPPSSSKSGIRGIVCRIPTLRQFGLDLTLSPAAECAEIQPTEALGTMDIPAVARFRHQPANISNTAAEYLPAAEYVPVASPAAEYVPVASPAAEYVPVASYAAGRGGQRLYGQARSNDGANAPFPAPAPIVAAASADLSGFAIVGMKQLAWSA